MPLNWKSGVIDLLHHSGALRAVRVAARRWERNAHGRIQAAVPWKCVVLCYHRVGQGGAPLYSRLAPERFEEQIRFVSRNFRTISLEQMLREMRDPGARGQAVVITFDDGYRDLHQYAVPILRKYHAPATVYLTAGSIESGEVAWYDRVYLAMDVVAGDEFETEVGGERLKLSLRSSQERLDAGTQINQRLRRVADREREEYCRQLEKRIALPDAALRDRMLSWEQVREMRKAGISIGAHTMTHRVVSRLDREALQTELVESKKVIESRLGDSVADFAYPFGQPADCGSAAEAILGGAGYRSAALTVEGSIGASTNPLRLRRFSMSDKITLSRFAMLLTRTFLSAPANDSQSEPPSFGENKEMEKECATF